MKSWNKDDISAYKNAANDENIVAKGWGGVFYQLEQCYTWA